MSTLSIPLPTNLAEFVDEMVERGFAPTKAEVVRRALIRLAEEEAINAVLRSEQEIKDGKILKGDLRKLMKTLP